MKVEVVPPYRESSFRQKRYQPHPLQSRCPLEKALELIRRLDGPVEFGVVVCQIESRSGAVMVALLHDGRRRIESHIGVGELDDIDGIYDAAGIRVRVDARQIHETDKE